MTHFDLKVTKTLDRNLIHIQHIFNSLNSAEPHTVCCCIVFKAMSKY